MLVAPSRDDRLAALLALAAPLAREVVARPARRRRARARRRVGGARRDRPARADGGVHERRPRRRPRPARERERRRPRARRRAARSSTATSFRPRSRRCSTARPRTSRRSPAGRPTWRAGSSSRSAAASTTGPRSSSARGSPRRPARRSGSSARAPTPAAAGATRAASSPTRRSRCSGSSSVDAAPVLADPGGLVEAVADAGVVAVGLSPRWRSEGIGATRRALVRDARPPCCSSTAARARACLAPSESRTRFTWTRRSLTTRLAAGRARRGRASRSRRSSTLQPIRVETYAPSANVPYTANGRRPRQLAHDPDVRGASAPRRGERAPRPPPDGRLRWSRPGPVRGPVPAPRERHVEVRLRVVHDRPEVRHEQEVGAGRGSSRTSAGSLRLDDRDVDSDSREVRTDLPRDRAIRPSSPNGNSVQ